jgi:hypothetical protein
MRVRIDVLTTDMEWWKDVPIPDMAARDIA